MTCRHSPSEAWTVGEGETADFVVTLVPASGQTVTVSYETADGSARMGEDYNAASASLTFTAGETEKTIAVPTRDDVLDEPDETFLVTLSNPSGATLEDGSATGTIIDDDVPVPPPTLSIADATVVEGETARFAVGLSRASEQTVTVSYRTAGGTAAAGRDFDAAFGTLTFGPRTTQQVIAVPTREDKLDEPDETFLVTLSNPNGATIQDGTATGTIADDDVRSLAPINRELLAGDRARAGLHRRPLPDRTSVLRHGPRLGRGRSSARRSLSHRSPAGWPMGMAGRWSWRTYSPTRRFCFR